MQQLGQRRCGATKNISFKQPTSSSSDQCSLTPYLNDYEAWRAALDHRRSGKNIHWHLNQAHFHTYKIQHNQFVLFYHSAVLSVDEWPISTSWFFTSVVNIKWHKLILFTIQKTGLWRSDISNADTYCLNVLLLQCCFLHSEVLVLLLHLCCLIHQNQWLHLLHHSNQ